MKVRIVGDIHGKVHGYGEVVKDVDHSIQIGDFGVGFFQPGTERWEKMIDIQNSGDHTFFRGNHDNPEMCRELDAYMGDFGYYNDIMWIAGAYSIDAAWRVEGRDWWSNEELTTAQWNDVISIYMKRKPKILLTHDCPLFVSKQMFIDKGLGMGNQQLKTRTGQFLERLHAIHEPDTWIFGHWHHTATLQAGKTQFHCLGELAYMDIEV